MAKDTGLQNFEHSQRGLHVDQQIKSHAYVVLRRGVNFKICSLKVQGVWPFSCSASNSK